MTATKLKLGLGALLAGGAAILVIQYQSQGKLRGENESLRQQMAQLKADHDSNPVVPVVQSKSLPEEQLNELLRLRGQVGVLRRETNEMARQLAANRASSAAPNPAAPPGNAAPLPEEYPKTPDGATRGIFEAWARGDFNAFFTNFAEPGVPREMYERLFTDPAKSNYLFGMEVVSLGEPTNSFGPNMWFVPYKVRFKDGSEKEFRLHVAQDSRTQRWFFKGGF